MNGFAYGEWTFQKIIQGDLLKVARKAKKVLLISLKMNN